MTKTAPERSGRVCRDCGRPITRGSITGRCRPCAAKARGGGAFRDPAFAARAGSIRSSARLSGENAAALAAALRQIAETIERVAGRVDAIERAAELLERTALDKDGRNGK
ncbi:MAG: hypothetical protein U0556_09755 [Dehalococcoidia bacterium]